jgi:hypothetical protein
MIDFVIWLILRICLPLMPIWVSGAAKGFGFDKIDFTFPNETIIVIGFILPIVVAKDLRNRQTLWLVILGCLPGFLLYTFAIFAKGYAPPVYFRVCWVGTGLTAGIIVLASFYQYKQYRIQTQGEE